MIKKIIYLFQNKNQKNISSHKDNKSSNIQNKEIVNTLKLDEDEINYFISLEVARRTDTLQSYNLNELDSYAKEAAIIIVKNKGASYELLQKKFNIGYNRAGRLMDQLEGLNIIKLSSLYNSSNKVLVKDIAIIDKIFTPSFWTIKKEIFQNNYLQNFENQIKEQVNNYYTNLESEKESKMKDQLKEEFLQKELKRLEKIKIAELKEEVLNELKQQGLIEEYRHREPIPQDVQDRVWNRDEGKCTKCGSKNKLEFDHIIPFSKGGANTYRNLQLLCEDCNRKKSNKIG